MGPCTMETPASLHSLLDRLTRSQDWNWAYELVDAWAEETANLPLLATLHAQLLAREDPSRIAFAGVRQHLEATLALAPDAQRGRAAADLLLAAVRHRASTCLPA